MPFLGGQIFVWYKDHSVVYKAMFVWGTFLSVVTTTIFYFIDPDEDDRLKRVAQARAQGTAEEEEPEVLSDAWYHGPVGAALCDRLCFPGVFAGKSNSVTQQSAPQGQRT